MAHAVCRRRGLGVGLPLAGFSRTGSPRARLASGWFASGRFASGRLLLHRLASHRPVPRRPHRRRRAALGAALALVALAAAFLPVAAGRPGEAVSAPASSIPASSAGFTYRTLPSPAEFAAAAGHAAAPIPSVAGDRAVQLQSPNPLSTAKCLATIKLRCYSPLQYRVAYDLDPLYAGGVTGKGQTIMIVDSFGSPTIRHDLAYFDRQWGLPDPTLNVFKLGKLPPFDKSSATMDGWAEEATLDVEYAHAVAPEAAIDLVETPVAETEGVTGFPQMMAAEKALIDRGGVDVISQSFGATEDTFPGFAKASYASLQSLRYAFKDAAQHDVTVLAAAGDTGATDDEPDGASLYPYAAVAWPSSDPLVTSVGGTQLLLAQDGNKIQPDQVWNDDYGAGGGGRSAVFSQPALPEGRGPRGPGPPRHPGHLDVGRGQRRRLGLPELRARRGGLGDPRRHQRGHPAVRRRRRPGQPAGRPPARQHRHRAVHAGPAEPDQSRRAANRHPGRHHRR